MDDSEEANSREMDGDHGNHDGRWFHFLECAQLPVTRLLYCTCCTDTDAAIKVERWDRWERHDGMLFILLTRMWTVSVCPVCMWRVQMECTVRMVCRLAGNSMKTTLSFVVLRPTSLSSLYQSCLRSRLANPNPNPAFAAGQLFLHLLFQQQQVISQ